MNQLLHYPALALVGATLATVTIAGEDAHREYGAHMHGSANLNIALEANTLFLELQTPSANLVGFEHAPRTTEQKQNVHEAIETLENGTEAFLIDPAAGCTLTRAEVETGMLEGSEEHEEHGSEEMSHAAHEEEVHSEFHATWEFNCSNAQALDSIDVRLFGLFSGISEIDAQVISASGQTAVELSPSATRIAL